MKKELTSNYMSRQVFERKLRGERKLPTRSQGTRGYRHDPAGGPGNDVEKDPGKIKAKGSSNESQYFWKANSRSIASFSPCCRLTRLSTSPGFPLPPLPYRNRAADLNHRGSGSQPQLQMQSGRKMTESQDVVCLADFEDHARRLLPKYAFDFYSSGANDQETLKENVNAFKR